MCFVNLGDSYASEGKNRTAEQATTNSTLAGSLKSQLNILKQPTKIAPGIKAMDRVGIPERFALAMQADGWWWRDTIVWKVMTAAACNGQEAATEAMQVYPWIADKFRGAGLAIGARVPSADGPRCWASTGCPMVSAAKSG